MVAFIAMMLKNQAGAQVPDFEFKGFRTSSASPSTDHVGHPVSQVQVSADHVGHPVSLA